MLSPSSQELNRLIRTAALTLDQQGRIGKMAKKAGLSKCAITTAIQKGRISAGMASALERAVGREVLKAEDLCPDLHA